MESIGEHRADEVPEDLPCPGCEYNLRGLRGPIVHCPECGLQCDVSRMLAQRWVRPWDQAPGFRALVMPLTWLLFSIMPLPILYVAESQAGSEDGVLTVAAASFVVMVWLTLLCRAHVQVPDRGAAMVLLAHVLFLGYLLSASMVVWSVIMALEEPGIGTGLAALLIAPAMCMLFALCRRGERGIAERCMRQYMSRNAAGAVERP